MKTEWYVIDTRTNTIINCLTNNGEEPNAFGWENPESLRFDKNPPREMLERYRYWDERP